MQQVRIRINLRKRIGEERLLRNGGFANGIELRLEQAHGVAQDFVHVYADKFRRGHFGEIAEAADDVVQVGQLRFQGRGGLVEDFEEVPGFEPSGLLQVFDGDLHGEKRIAQFVGEAARKFAPGGDALGLQQALLLRCESSRHIVKSNSQLADFIASARFDARVPASGGDLAGAFGKFFDRLGDARGNPEADQHANEERGGRDSPGTFQDFARELDQFSTRTADKKDAQEFVIPPGQRNGVKGFGIRRVARPFDRSNQRLRLLLQLLDERSEALLLVRINFFAKQRGGDKARIEVGVDERAHSGGKNQGSQKVLINVLPADDVQALVSNRVIRANDGQRERHAVGELLFFQESVGVIPVLDRGYPIEFGADARGILNRRDKNAVGIHHLYVIESMLLRGAKGIMHVK